MYHQERDASTLYEKNPHLSCDDIEAIMKPKWMMRAPTVNGFLSAALQFRNMPIQTALHSDNSIIKILAILDGRVGKRTFANRLLMKMPIRNIHSGCDSFTIYDYLKETLIQYGIPAEEIAFIHDAKTDAQRDALFKEMRTGKKKVLIGSTDKCGTGVNVQTHLGCNASCGLSLEAKLH